MKKQQLEAGKHWHEHPGHGPRTTVGLGKSIPEPAELWEPEKARALKAAGTK